MQNIGKLSLDVFIATKNQSKSLLARPRENTNWRDIGLNTWKYPTLGFFYVSTSKDYSKTKSTVVCVGKNDYVECFEPTLKTKNSYYDTLLPIVVTKDEINCKTSDPENGFRNVARLKEHAFRKFLEKAKKIKLQQRPPITPKKLAGIIGSFTPSEITDETLRELHLIS